MAAPNSFSRSQFSVQSIIVDLTVLHPVQVTQTTYEKVYNYAGNPNNFLCHFRQSIHTPASTCSIYSHREQCVLKAKKKNHLTTYLVNLNENYKS
uniref:Uncharacterized protein n=1 Tax=Arion vulgaris TaxID=1028688 RepID=A0A0B6YPX4_9EUPU